MVKYIKIIAFYTLLSVWFFEMSKVHSRDMGEKAAENIRDGLKSASEAIAEGIENASPLLGEKAAEALGKDVLKAIEKIMPFCNDVSFYFQIVSMLYTSGKVIDMCNDFYKHVFPTDEQKLAKELISKEFKLLTAQSNFRQCLGNNAFANKNSAGYPFECEDIAKKIIELNSSNDDFIEKTIKTFEKFYPDYIKNK